MLATENRTRVVAKVLTIADVHLVDIGVLHNTRQEFRECLEQDAVGPRKSVDQHVQLDDLVFGIQLETLQELEVQLSSQYACWQLTEVQLEQTCHGVNVIVSLDFNKIHVTLSVVSLTQSLDDSV